MNTQPLSIIANVTVVTSSPQVAAPTFNIGLIIGPTPAIPSYGANSRVRQYSSTTFSTAMISDGFTASSPEYIAAQLYFSQSPAPQFLMVGRQDLTAAAAITIDSGNVGTGYVVGDVVTITKAGGGYGTARVTTVGANGTVTGLTLLTGGTGYSVQAAIPTTGGTGTGLEVDITAIGETCLQAAQACRSANPKWWPFMVTSAVDADHTAISAWVLTQPGTVYFGNSSSVNVQNGIANNLFQTLFAANSKRTWMQWASTQGGLNPNQIYFTAAVMGQAMASNTQLSGSAFTEKFSGGVPLVGVFTENNLSQTQIQNIEGTDTTAGPNGNLYLNYGNAFNVLEQGTMMAPGVFFDEVLNLDILGANIQYEIINLVTRVPKIPQTDAGQQLLIQAIEQALKKSADTGFLAPGVWKGQNILNKVVPGQTLPTGFAVVSPSYKGYDTAKIALRQAPPIYIALIEAGAVHSVTVQVMVQI